MYVASRKKKRAVHLHALARFFFLLSQTTSTDRNRLGELQLRFLCNSTAFIFVREAGSAKCPDRNLFRRLVVLMYQLYNRFIHFCRKRLRLLLYC